MTYVVKYGEDYLPHSLRVESRVTRQRYARRFGTIHAARLVACMNEGCRVVRLVSKPKRPENT